MRLSALRLAWFAPVFGGLEIAPCVPFALMVFYRNNHPNRPVEGSPPDDEADRDARSSVPKPPPTNVLIGRRSNPRPTASSGNPRFPSSSPFAFARAAGQAAACPPIHATAFGATPEAGISASSANPRRTAKHLKRPRAERLTSSAGTFFAGCDPPRLHSRIPPRPQANGGKPAERGDDPQAVLPRQARTARLHKRRRGKLAHKQTRRRRGAD